MDARGGGSLLSLSPMCVYEHRRVELKFVYEYRVVLMRIKVSAILVIFMGIECASL